MKSINKKMSFYEWLKWLEPKPKFYIWTEKQKQQIKDICLETHDIWLLLRVELQDIKYEKVVEILECKYRL